MMTVRLAISNIAWEPGEREDVYALMAKNDVRGLEIAPSLTFFDETDPFNPSETAVSKFIQDIARYDLKLVSMQSILFGVKGANLFQEVGQRQRVEDGLLRAGRLAARLGIPNLVFGSPGNRAIPEMMTRSKAEQIAVDLFRRVGDKFIEAGIKLALEPNAAAYGTNFLNSVQETTDFLTKVNHPAICLNFDIGSLHMNDEFEEGVDLFLNAGGIVSHVHVSEPELIPAPQDATSFARLARGILASGYKGWFSIEMRNIGENNLKNVESRIATCRRALRAAEHLEV